MYEINDSILNLWEESRNNKNVMKTKALDKLYELTINNE